MSTLLLLHVLLGTAGLLTGLGVFARRKGGASHRALGWVYVLCMGGSLVAILVAARAHPAPFYGYAVVILVTLAAAVSAPRLRGRLRAWRSWHAALMSLSMLGAAIAVGGVVVGGVLGVGSGPAYYRVFDVVVAGFTAIGLALIGTRPVIWGTRIAPREKSVRAWFSGLVVALSLGLVALQLTASSVAR